MIVLVDIREETIDITYPWSMESMEHDYSYHITNTT